MDGHQTTSDDVKSSSTFESMNQFSVVFKEQENKTIETTPIEWRNITTINLHQMNEDCLLEIFSVKTLDLMDWCSIAETCKRFRQITQRIVPKEVTIKGTCKSMNDAPEYEYDIKFSISRERTENNVETFFRNFGSSMSTIEIQGPLIDPEDSFLLILVTKYCVEDNLKSLRIQWFRIPDVLTVKLKPIFQQLQNLRLWCLSVPSDATLFSKLESLVELAVLYVENSSVILENIFPKLERFQYVKTVYEPTLQSFFAINKTLKELFLHVRCDDSCEMAILQEIGNSCVDLQKLNLQNIGSIVQPLQTLKSLRTLELEKVSLEDVRLFSRQTEFACWPQLTKLVISKCHQSIDVVGIVSRLTNLEDLAICSGLILNEKTFSEIVSIVKGRPNVLTLKCEFDFTAKNLCSNQRVRLM